MCSVGASLLIWLTPVGIQGTRGGVRPDGSTFQEDFTSSASWYEHAGLWGFFVLVLFSLPALIGVRAATTGRSLELSVLAALLMLACLLAGFSIGFTYLPAAVALAVAAVLSWIRPTRSS